MTGDCHVPICEGLGVRFPWATRLGSFVLDLPNKQLRDDSTYIGTNRKGKKSYLD